jgi:hypothetical protein
MSRFVSRLCSVYRQLRMSFESGKLMAIPMNALRYEKSLLILSNTVNHLKHGSRGGISWLSISEALGATAYRSTLSWRPLVGREKAIMLHRKRGEKATKKSLLRPHECSLVHAMTRVLASSAVRNAVSSSWKCIILWMTGREYILLSK